MNGNIYNENNPKSGFIAFRVIQAKQQRKKTDSKHSAGSIKKACFIKKKFKWGTKRFASSYVERCDIENSVFSSKHPKSIIVLRSALN